MNTTKAEGAIVNNDNVTQQITSSAMHIYIYIYVVPTHPFIYYPLIIITYPHNYSTPRNTSCPGTWGTPCSRSNSWAHTCSSASTCTWRLWRRRRLRCTTPPCHRSRQIPVQQLRPLSPIAKSPLWMLCSNSSWGWWVVSGWLVWWWIARTTASAREWERERARHKTRRQFKRLWLIADDAVCVRVCIITTNNRKRTQHKQLLTFATHLKHYSYIWYLLDTH